MIKKWVFASVAYLLIVIIGFSVYSSVIDTSSGDSHSQKMSHEENK
jgi:hypothetical protein